MDYEEPLCYSKEFECLYYYSRDLLTGFKQERDSISSRFIRPGLVGLWHEWEEGKIKAAVHKAHAREG